MEVRGYMTKLNFDILIGRGQFNLTGKCYHLFLVYCAVDNCHCEWSSIIHCKLWMFCQITVIDWLLIYYWLIIDLLLILKLLIIQHQSPWLVAFNEGPCLFTPELVNRCLKLICLHKLVCLWSIVSSWVSIIYTKGHERVH